MEDLVIYQVENGIASLILNRAEKRNALNPELVEALKIALVKAENDAQIRLIVLKGSAKAFSAGADLAYLKKLQTNTFEENLQDSVSLKDLFLQIYQSKKIIIAQVEGPALAGGCGLATVCDFVFATLNASFGYTEVKIGFIPAIVSYFLLKKIGEGKAKELLLTGVILSAEEALTKGLIYKICPEESIGNEVNNFAASLATHASGQAIAMTKSLIAALQDSELEIHMDTVAQFNAKARGTDDCKRGINAFLNKEKITW